MKKIGAWVLFLFLSLSYSSFAQLSVTLKPGAATGKDAYFQNLTPNRNSGSHPDFDALAWTNGGRPVTARSVIDFDFSSIPAGVTIDSAFLSLYNNPTSVNNTGLHSSLSGPNTCYLKRITSSWDETTVTWNTQPSTTTLNQVSLPQSTSANQDFTHIDVTQLVRDMINLPASSFGFMIRLQTESFYRCVIFASSDNTDNTKHPDIVVYYSFNTDCNTDTSLAPTVCENFTTPSGQVLTTTGIYQDTIPNAAGCDSIIHIDLTVNRPDVRIIVTRNSLRSIATSSTFRWLDCNNSFLPIPTQVGPIFQPMASGSYAVEVTKSGCVDTSFCANMLYVGMNDYSAMNSINTYPNPISQGFVTIDLGSLKNVSIAIFNSLGQVVHQQQRINTHLYQFELNEVPPGIYTLAINSTSGDRKVFKLIKK